VATSATGWGVFTKIVSSVSPTYNWLPNGMDALIIVAVVAGNVHPGGITSADRSEAEVLKLKDS